MYALGDEQHGAQCTEGGVISIAEVALAALVLLIILTCTGLLLAGEESASVSYRSDIHAQNIADAEVAQLQSQAGDAVLSGTFPPADTDANSGWFNGGSKLTALNTYTNSGTTYTTYVVGGWCTQGSSLTGVDNFHETTWSTYGSYSDSDPPAYWVGVLVTWVKTRSASTGSVSINTAWQPVFDLGSTKSSNVSLIVSAVSTPTTVNPPTSSVACPAKLE